MYVIPEKKQPLDPYQVRARLPKIGDRLLAHRWYEVEFQGLRGPYRECYKLPEGEGYR